MREPIPNLLLTTVVGDECGELHFILIPTIDTHCLTCLLSTYCLLLSWGTYYIVRDCLHMIDVYVSNRITSIPLCSLIRIYIYCCTTISLSSVHRWFTLLPFHCCPVLHHCHHIILDGSTLFYLLIATSLQSIAITNLTCCDCWYAGVANIMGSKLVIYWF